MANQKNIWRPYTQEQTAPLSLHVERARGPHLYTSDGRKIFDAISSWWVITHGHCEPEIVEAVRRQAEQCEQVLFAHFSHSPAEELAEELLAAVKPPFKKVFLSDNGSTAVEVALKMCVQGWELRGEPERRIFLTFAHAYHGDTAGAMSVSAAGPFTAAFRKMTFHVIRADQPNSSTAPIEEWIAPFRKLLAIHEKQIAGVIIEPLVQGAGGMIMWPKEAVDEVSRLAKAAGTFLIFDEVMTGFGRTGSLFALDQLQVKPDILCLSKGLTGGMLPLGATLTTNEIFDLFYSVQRNRLFHHGHSFTGNALACAAAAASLKLIRRGAFDGKLSAIERINSERLALLAGRFSVNDPRARGTIAAFDLPTSDLGYHSQAAAVLTSFALKHGVFLRPLGHTIYLMPPYSSDATDLAQAWDALESFLGEINS